MRQTAKTEDVEQELAAIPKMSREDLVARWAEAYGRPPPKGLSRRLLEYSAAYHIQAKAFGGLSASTRRKLRQIAKAHEQTKSGQASAKPSIDLSPGSRLIREWHGRTFTVDVLDQGYLCDGQRYRSLSEIARAITGARWSGPRFFGL